MGRSEKLPVILHATTSMGDTQIYESSEEIKVGEMEFRPYDDGEETIEDDLMLTKTEGSAMLKFGSAVCST